jgi:hypothetical protein
MSRSPSVNQPLFLPLAPPVFSKSPAFLKPALPPPPPPYSPPPPQLDPPQTGMSKRRPRRALLPLLPPTKHASFAPLP